MSKSKLACLLVLAGGYMALGLNCIPNIGRTLNLTGLLGGLLG